MKMIQMTKTLLLSSVICANVFAANLKGTFDLKPATIEEQQGEAQGMNKTIEFKKDGTLLVFQQANSMESNSLRPQMPMHGNYYVDKKTGFILVELEFSDGKNSQFFKMYVNSKDLGEATIGDEKEVYLQSSIYPNTHVYHLTKQK